MGAITTAIIGDLTKRVEKLEETVAELLATVTQPKTEPKRATKPKG